MTKVPLLAAAMICESECETKWIFLRFFDSECETKWNFVYFCESECGTKWNFVCFYEFECKVDFCMFLRVCVEFL